MLYKNLLVNKSALLLTAKYHRSTIENIILLKAKKSNKTDIKTVKKVEDNSINSSIARNLTEIELEEVQALEHSIWILVLVSHCAVILAVFGFSFGVQAVPFVVNAEYFPTWLRAQVRINFLLKLCMFSKYHILRN